ncbi:hypothetical protein LOD99_11650 [Oopsacas minuta]|uniref:Probable glycerol kinase n=1 Tax=Oopsacas minuta TaxID=111878 RepID=A0AAV7JKQ1_9METZ|nr:hypothetical protein LOD99_11650 [Oopsacas minuta]
MDPLDEPTKLIGAIDQGTSSSKFLLFDPTDGRVVASHQIDLHHKCPHEGWFEQDPGDIIGSVQNCIIEVLGKEGISKEIVKTIGITNQRETTILWDKTTGRPLGPAIVWCDSRTADLAEQYIQKTKSKSINDLQLKCGLPIHPYFSALKIRWLIDNVELVKEALEDGRLAFGTVDTWLIWNFTEVHVTDVTNASRTMLMNIKTLEWDDELLEFFDIPKCILPDIKSSSEVYGEILGGELRGVTISGCLGDQSAALVGQGCFAKGQAKNTYGTGCFMLYNTGLQPSFSEHGLLTTVGYQLGPGQSPVYALEGSIAQAGDIVRWVRDNLNFIKDSSDIEKLANEVQDTGGVYFVPAFSGLYAPHWASDARGMIIGLTAYSDKRHIARAVLEAVCFMTREILEAMTQDAGIHLASLQVDGGMTANNLLMQLQADLLGITVIRPQMKESTALGAAMAAGLAVDAWNIHVLNNRISDNFKPSVLSDDRDARYARWKRAIPRSIGWASDSDASSPSNSPPMVRRGVYLGGALSIGFVLGIGLISLWRKFK